jgi:hypothetical protein
MRRAVKNQEPRPKLAEGLPAPRPLTDEQRAALARADKAWGKAFAERVAEMERFTPDDLKVRAR